MTEILAVILKSLKESGKFDDLRRLVSRNGRWWQACTAQKL